MAPPAPAVLSLSNGATELAAEAGATRSPAASRAPRMVELRAVPAAFKNGTGAMA